MPPAVVTVISTVPLPLGDTAEIDVEEVTENVVAAVVPNMTAVALERPVPEMVTVVLPLAGPAVGEIDVTAGTAT